MAQEHFDRLTAIDASFLHQEGPDSHMHVGALARFEGPPPPFDEFLDSLRMRLHLVPRYRQKLQVPPPAAAGRCGSTTRRSTSSTTSARPRCHAGHRGPAPAPDRPDLLPAARPRPAAVGGVDGRGPRGRRLRADLQDPPRDDRRVAGVDIAQVMFDLAPVPAEIDAPRRGVAARAPEPCRRRGSRRAAVGPPAAPGSAARRTPSACSAPAGGARRRARGGRGSRRDRLGGAEPRAR